jgi:thiaminase
LLADFGIVSRRRTKMNEKSRIMPALDVSVAYINQNVSRQDYAQISMSLMMIFSIYQEIARKLNNATDILVFKD